MEKNIPTYLLFPALTLPEQDFRNLYIFLPRLYLLEISRPASIPEWARDRFQGLSPIADPELMGQIKSCVREYQAFAEMHGGVGGTLGYLTQAIDNMSDARFKIQEQLRGRCPAGLDETQLETLRSAVFLDISRQYDDREVEMASSLARAGELEKEFGEILGITKENGSEIPAGLDLPLLSESQGAQYMLPERIESWFRLLPAQACESIPVPVASGPEAAFEAIDMLRIGLARTGRQLSSSRIPLGSFPRLDALGQKQFRSLIEAPGAPPIFSAYQKKLDSFLSGTCGFKDTGALESEAAPLRQCLEKACRICSVPGEENVTLYLELIHEVSCSEAAEILATGGTRAVPMQETAGHSAMFLFLD